MKQLQIKNTATTVTIEKGFIKKKYIYTYNVLLILFILLFLYSYKHPDTRLYYIFYFLFQSYLTYLMVNILIISFIIILIMPLFSIFINLFYESIELNENIILMSMYYSITLRYTDIKEICVFPSFRYNNLRYKNATLRGIYKDKCTIVIKNIDNEEYEWGYNLNYQEGIEIKALLDNKIKELEVKRV